MVAAAEYSWGFERVLFSLKFAADGGCGCGCRALIQANFYWLTIIKSLIIYYFIIKSKNIAPNEFIKSKTLVGSLAFLELGSVRLYVCPYFRPQRLVLLVN